MQLSPEDVAAAEACGVSFLPATPAQVQRLAMQRKIFYAAGQPILATRGDGFFETAGTLQRVIEEGRQQQRDLAAWEGGEPPVEAAAEPPAPEPGPVLVTEAEEPAARETAEVVAHVEEPAPRRRARRSRPAPADTDVWPFEEEAAPAPPTPAGTMTKAAGGAGAPPQQQPGRRWVMAGAARRGRAGKHWSQRQR